MHGPNNTLLTPYGAYELKSTYQRNLSLAFMATIMLVGLAVLAGWLLSSSPPAVVTDIPDRDGGIFDIKLPPTILPRPPDIPAGQPAARPLAGTIPVPVEDDLVSDDQMLPTSEDLRLALPIPFDPEAEGNGALVIENTEPTIPERTEFQRREVYPEMIHAVAPDYPRQAKTLGLEGDVVVQALVGPGGRSSTPWCWSRRGLRRSIRRRSRPPTNAATNPEYRTDTRLPPG